MERVPVLHPYIDSLCRAYPSLSSQSRLSLWTTDLRNELRLSAGSMNTSLRWMVLTQTFSRRMFPTTQVLVISGVLAAPLPRVWRTPSTWTTFDVPLRSRTLALLPLHPPRS